MARDAVANEAPAERRVAATAGGDVPTTPRVFVTLVGTLAEGSELVALLRELLERQGLACEFENTPRFDPDQLFAEETGEVDVRVFVRLAEPDAARLYFRGPAGERFLLRSIALRNGLDDVGRELVGQVVESSVVALLRSSTGLSREEASAEVARETRPSERPPQGQEEPQRAQPETRRAPSLSLTTMIRYGLESSGPEFELAHGPGIELGVGGRGSPFLRARLGADAFFEQSIDSADLKASLRTVAVRASFDAGLALAPRTFLALGIGAGADVTRIDPGETVADSVAPADPRTNVVPVVRSELRYELDVGRVVLGAAAFVDVSLVRTHYDLLDGGDSTEVAVPWTARPGAALLAGLHW